MGNWFVYSHTARGKFLGAFSCVPVHNRTPREKHLGSKRRPILGSVFGFINEKNKASKKKYNKLTRVAKTIL